MAAAKQKKKKTKTKKTTMNKQAAMGLKKKARSFPSSSAPPRDAPPSSSSLFENLWTKRKFDVVGKKRKAEGLRVGLSRSLAIEKRKKTLLKEFKARGKSNVFQDRRFGEDNEALAEEDKAILRFQRERQAQWQKRSKFTLGDEEDKVAVLTHEGTALSMLDDFNDTISEEDDADDRQDLNDQIVREFHFGGDRANVEDVHEGDSNKPKSKKEVMEEIIAKSKLYKAQKVREKEEDAELKDQLDRDFTELARSEALVSLMRVKKTRSAAESSDKDKPDDFDKLVKEMGQEMRAHASDRLKTDEERAEEERARLEELEEKRKQRMLGEFDSEEDREVEPTRDEKGKARRKRLEISGDDLGENFLMDDEKPKKGWVQEVLTRTSEGSSSEEQQDGDTSANDSEEVSGNKSVESDSDEEFSDETSDEAWEKSDDEGQLISLESIQGREKIKEFIGGAERKGGLVDRPQDNLITPLPFVIEAPESLEELKGLVDNRPLKDLLAVIQRIRTCNSIRLAAENRRKMQIFYGVLLQYFASITGENAPSLERVDALVQPLIEMTAETPYFAAVCARQRIVRMHQQFMERLKNSDAIGPWPSMRTLMLLRLWSIIFPTSDFRHVVMTPSILLMAEYLTRCRVTSGRDLAVGIFLCGLLLSIMRLGKRFCPEALCFLYNLLLSAIPVKKRIALASLAACKSEASSQTWLLIQMDDLSKSNLVYELDFMFVMTLDRDSAFFNTNRFRLGGLNSALRTLEGFSHLYEDFSCYPEIFSPFEVVLQHLLEDQCLPQTVISLLNDLVLRFKENISKHETVRQPLRLRVKKPAPIKQFNPKFEENFVRGRNYDPNRERAERKKLQRLLKQETKGAARELRKDNYFLQVEKAKEKALVEEQREEKYRKAMAFLQEQESAAKSGQLGKGRKRRR